MWTGSIAPWIGVGGLVLLMTGLVFTLVSFNRRLKNAVDERTLALRKTNERLERENAERRLAEAALRGSEKKYRELVENANSVILRMDPTGIITFFNEFAQRLFGYEAREVIGRHVIGTIVSQTDRTGRDLTGMIQQICKNPEGCGIIESENMRRDGTRLWISWTCKAVYDDSGNLEEILCVGMDSTLRKQVQDSLRVSEAYHRRLFEDSPTALCIQDFSGVGQFINHLKIRGVADPGAFLADHPDEAIRLAKSVRFIQVNQAAVNLYRANSPMQLLKSLDSVLIQSDCGHFADQIVAFAKGETRYEGEARNHTLEGDVIEVIIRKAIIMDREPVLSRVLVSVIDVTERNRSMREREELDARLRQAQKTEAAAALASGLARDFDALLMGIRDDIARMPIEQAHESGISPFLKRIEGHVEKGSDLVRQLRAFSIAEPTAPPPEAVPPNDPETILLVDDEDLIIDVGTQLLSQMGYRVLVAKTGREALSCYSANAGVVRLVILDMIIPDMSGGEVFDAIRRLNPQAKVLLSSGYGLEGEASEILKRGCNGFLQKPFRLDQLSNQIRDIIYSR